MTSSHCCPWHRCHRPLARIKSDHCCIQGSLTCLPESRRPCHHLRSHFLFLESSVSAPQKADYCHPFQMWKGRSVPLQEDPYILSPVRGFQTLSCCCLLLQCPLQNRWQFLATHGSPAENTQTSLLTQIVFFRHSSLQNLRQGRYVFFSGVLPKIEHQAVSMRLSNRLPGFFLHSAILKV